MKKSISFLLLMLCCTWAFAQETHIRVNEDALFYEGRMLFEQRKFGASIENFEKFLHHSTAVDKGLQQEAEYYIVCCKYELKDKRALELLKKYLTDYPYSAMGERVSYMIGRCYFEAKKYEETISWYEKVKNNRLDGNENMCYLYTKAYSYLQLKRYEPARVLFATLSGKKTIYEKDAQYYLAYTEFCLGNYQNALNGFLPISNGTQYSEPASYHILQIYDLAGDDEHAIELGKQLVNRYPNSKYNGEAYRILGEASYNNENYSEAIDYLRKYERSGQKVQRADMYMLGMAYYKHGDYRSAVPAFSKVTSTNDSLSQNAYLYIGLSYAKYGDKKNARMAFQNAAKENFDPNAKEEADYNYVLAVYEDAAPFGESVKAFEKFIEDYPKSKHIDDIYGHLATIYVNEKDYKTAYASLQKIKVSNPKIKAVKENVLFQLGTTEFLAKNYQQAEEYFTLSLKEYTSASFSAQAYMWRGETYYQLGEYDKARKDLTKFLGEKQEKSKQEKLKSYYTIAYSYYEEENYTSALEWYKKYLAEEDYHKAKLYCDVLNRAGDCYFIGRKYDEARTYYQQSAENSTVFGDYGAYQNAFILGVQKRYGEKIEALNLLLDKFPKSEYADDAMYEIGRAYVLLEKNDEAITAYNRVLTQYSKTPLARKASLEIGMLYANKGDDAQAIAAYKNVVNNYPSSEEAKVAIESMQSIYVENNQINDYLAYRESIAGSTISTVKKSLEDSLNYVAAERLFMKEKYKEATASFREYIQNYCDNQTLNCISAQYYLAESYYKTDLKDKALEQYEQLANLVGNQYQEEALIRGAEISYDQQDFEKALGFFERLFECSSNNENKNVARIGMLRCSYKLELYNKTILAANDLLDDVTADPALIREARYCRAKAYIANEEAILATEDLQELSQDLRHEMGAEAKYLYAEQLYKREQYTTAEQEIMNFIEQNTPHQYWLARSFVLLADIYVKQGDDFQAKQYLLSLQANYKADDDIESLINKRLQEISERETNEIDQ